jgi:hypothetical protein
MNFHLSWCANAHDVSCVNRRTKRCFVPDKIASCPTIFIHRGALLPMGTPLKIGRG